MSELSQLPNIGAVIENNLNAVGITTKDELVALGSKAAFTKMRLQDNTLCLNMLCALEGAVQGVRWHNLSDATKSDLRDFYNSL